ALAARAPIILAEQLRHHGLGVAAFGKIRGMAAIGRGYDIVGTQRIAHADRDRLLPDRKMHWALDLVGRLHFSDRFHESPGQVELLVKPCEGLSVSARRPIRHANAPSIAVQQSPSAPSVNAMALLAKSSSTFQATAREQPDPS